MKRKMTENERVFFIAGIASLEGFQLSMQEQRNFDEFLESQVKLRVELDYYRHPDSVFGNLHKFYCDTCAKGLKHESAI